MAILPINAARADVAVDRIKAAGWPLAMVTLTVVFASMLSMTLSIGEDVSWGLLAAQQTHEDLNDSLTSFTAADPADLGLSRRQLISWWAPGPQQIIYGLLVLGLPLGAAVKAAAIAAWLIGLGAWCAYFLIVLREKWLAPWLTACLALFRNSHYSGFVFLGGETIFWPVVPLVLLANVQALTTARRRHLWAMVAGLVSTAAVATKYSAGLLAVSICAAWAWAFVTRRVTLARAATWSLGAAGGVLWVLAGGVGETLRGPTPASALCSVPTSAALAWAVGGPLMGMSDLAAALNTAARVIGMAPLDTIGTGGVALVLAAVCAAWLTSDWWTIQPLFQSGTPARQAGLSLALAVATVTAVSLAFMMLRGGCVSLSERFQQPGAYMLFPFLAEGLWASARWARRGARALAASLAVSVIALPVVYGASALADKAAVRSPESRAQVGSAGVRFDWTNGGRAREAEAELNANAAFRESLLVTTEPNVALMLRSQRVLFIDPSRAALERYHKGTWGRGVALLLTDVSRAGDIEAVKASFVGITEWRPLEVRALPRAAVWLGR